MSLSKKSLNALAKDAEGQGARRQIGVADWRLIEATRVLEACEENGQATITPLPDGRWRAEWEPLNPARRRATPPRYITYDLETLYARRPLDGAPAEAGVLYAQVGRDEYWTAYDHVGIAVLVAHDSFDDRFHVFSDALPDSHPARFTWKIRPLSEFPALFSPGVIAQTFNGIRFDHGVLGAQGVAPPADTPHSDLLLDCWGALDLPLDEYGDAHHGGLGDYALANLGVTKSLDGEQAPVRWQRGDYASVIEYCMRDVRLTERLFELRRSRGWLDNPVTGKRVNFL